MKVLMVIFMIYVSTLLCFVTCWCLTWCGCSNSCDGLLIEPAYVDEPLLDEEDEIEPMKTKTGQNYDDDPYDK